MNFKKNDMRCLSIILCFIFVFVSIMTTEFVKPTYASGQNLINNGDFSIQLPSGWGLWGVSGGVADSQMQLTVPAGKSEWDAGMAQEGMNIIPGRTYKLSFDVKASFSKKITAWVSKGNTNYLVQPVTLTTEYQRYSFIVDIPLEVDPDGQYGVKFSLGYLQNEDNSEGYTICFDNIELVDINPPVERTGKNVIENGGFEKGSDGWGLWVNMSISDNEPYEGQKCLYAAPAPQGGGVSVGGRTGIKLLPDTKYRLTAYMKSTKPGINFWETGAIFFMVDDQAEQKLGDLVSKTSSWGKQEVEFRTLSDSTKLYKIILFNFSKEAEVYFDNIELRPVDIKPVCFLNGVKIQTNNELKIIDEEVWAASEDCASILGGNYSFDAQTGVHTLTVKGKSISFKEGDNELAIGNVHVSLQRALETIDGKLYVPIIKMVEVFDFNYIFDNEDLILKISTGSEHGRPTQPEVIHVSAVDKNIISVDILQGKITLGSYVPYEIQPGDEIITKKSGYNDTIMEYAVKRNGYFIGVLAGKNRDMLRTSDVYEGEKLDKEMLLMPRSYRIVCDGVPVVPSAVYLKSQPVKSTWISAVRELEVKHTVYLKLNQPIQEGKNYEIKFIDVATKQESINYTHLPFSVRTEAIHINQAGFRPKDPDKKAFLSIWLGNGGSHTYGTELPKFYIINSSNNIVYTGNVRLRKSADEIDDFRFFDSNKSQTNVYVMDFSDFSMEGTFRIVVDGIGCSYDFVISNEHSWKQAFKNSMTGFYNQRSGTETIAEYGGFDRPINHKMGEVEGYKVYETTATLFDTGNGLGFLSNNMFNPLIEGKTDIEMPHAWGGYFDAGDYDRRIQHLEASRLQLMLFDMFKNKLENTRLSIPESTNHFIYMLV